MKINFLTILKSVAVLATFAGSGYFVYKQVQKRNELLEEEEDYNEQAYKASLNGQAKVKEPSEGKALKVASNSTSKKSGKKVAKVSIATTKVKKPKTSRTRKEEETGETYKGKTVYMGQQGGRYYYNKNGVKVYMRD